MHGPTNPKKNHDIYNISVVSRRNEREYTGDASHCIRCGV